MLEDLDDYRDLARTGEAAFVEKVKVPVLVVEPFAAAEAVAIETVSPGSLEVKGEARRVARIEKRTGANVFLAMVTVGRASNNDIVLEAEGVSKFHAFFFAGSHDRQTTLVDANSTYGTVVAGKRLVPRDRGPVSSGDVVQFGSVKATFFSPAGLYAHVAGLRR